MKKSKKNVIVPKSLSSLILQYGLPALILALVVYALWPEKSTEIKQPAASSTPQKLPVDLAGQLKVLGASLNSRELPNESWVADDFSKFLEPDGQTLDPKMSALLQKRFLTLKNRLALYQSLAEIQDLKELLENMVPGVITGGEYPNIRITLINTTSDAISLNALLNRLKVIYLGSEQGKMAFSEPFSIAEYNNLADALFISTMEYAEPSMMDSVVLHELKHAKQWRLLRKTRHNEALQADTLAGWEVEAHRLSDKVIDIGSHGEYKKRLAEVVGKKNAGNPHELILQITVNDMLYVDQTFAPAGLRENAQRKFQYIFGLGDIWIQTRYPKDQQGEAARKLYIELKKGMLH